MAENGWRIDLFGGLAARRGDQMISRFESRKVAALFACLALRLRRPQPRELLAEQLWPDEEWEVVRNRLRQGLSSLRQTLEPGVRAEESILLTDRSEASLNPAAVSTDVEEFEAALAEASATGCPNEAITHLRRAVALYKGDLLPGFYEEWVQSERERLAEMHRDSLARLANCLAVNGDLGAAIESSRRLVAADPIREDAHADLMRFYAAAGRAPDAFRQYRDLERILRDELGALPSPATRAILDEVRGAANAAPAALSVPAAGSRLLDTDPEGGAVSLDSPYYVERPTDWEFLAAVARKDSIVLVKGPRQIGKTSLLARGLHAARRGGARVVLTDLQKLDAEQLGSAEALFHTLADMIVDQLGTELPPEGVWSGRRGWNVDFERFLRIHVLDPRKGQLIWALDEVDRLFSCSFSDVVFGLFRSWHNERALNPDGPWRRLTLAITYATEAHLFITDLNQSPFNVGTRLCLSDFTPGEVKELIRRYGSPFRADEDVARYYRLVGGHPYLVRRGLHAAVAEGLDLASLEEQATLDNGLFGDHLRRMLIGLARDDGLRESVRAVLKGRPCPSVESFYRLRSAGVLTGTSASDARPRCGVYASYLRRHLS